MEIKNKNFIITTDEKTRETLVLNGFTEIGDNSGNYVFVNEPKKLMKFDYSKLKISFTNKLHF